MCPTYCNLFVNRLSVLVPRSVHDLHDELHNPLHVLGILLFIVSSYNHHKVHQIFGNLRKSKDGKKTLADPESIFPGWKCCTPPSPPQKKKLYVHKAFDFHCFINALKWNFTGRQCYMLSPGT